MLREMHLVGTLHRTFHRPAKIGQFAVDPRRHLRLARTEPVQLAQVASPRNQSRCRRRSRWASPAAASHCAPYSLTVSSSR
ncbi:hypothetical protein SBADM41S_01374 [Streptomyces badius]